MKFLDQVVIYLSDATLPPDGNFQTMTETMPSYEGAFVKMILALLALIVGIMGTVWFLKRMAGGRFVGGNERSIRLVEKKALSPKTILYLIEVEGKQTLLAESQHEIRKLMTLEASSEMNKEESEAID